MKQIIVTLVLLLSSLGAVSAQSASEWLAKLDSSLGERYAMDIAVSMGGELPLDGFFMVDGDGYYITLGAIEVYSDGKFRYEVNNERKEVVEDMVDLTSCDLLSNPTRAFDFVPEEFYSEVASIANESVALLLTPKSKSLGITSITLMLAIKGASVEPTTISYDYDGDMVTMTLTKLPSDGLKLRKWDKLAYRAYDIVSFL